VSIVEEISTDKDSVKTTQIVAFATIFLFLIARSPIWEMKWDASGYINSSLYWVNGSSLDPEQLYIRGFLTSIVYWLPSFVGMKFLEPSVFGTYIFVLVLIQNSVLISWMSAYLLPRIVKLFTPISKITVWATAAPSAYVMYGFAPYSLMDIWAVAAMAFGLVLILKERTFALAFAGVAFGIAFNLRPSNLVTILLIIFGFTLFKKQKSAFVISGFLSAQLPQIVYNQVNFGSWSIIPNGLTKIGGLNQVLDGASIRYDTVGYSQFTVGGISFCDVNMYKLVKNFDPQSKIDLLEMFLRNPISSTVFQIKKLAGAFWWPVDVPYYDHNPVVNTVFGAVILLLTTMGAGALIYLISKSATLNTLSKTIFYAVFLGFGINLVLYHSETRYGLLVVLLAVCGLAALITLVNNGFEPINRLRFERTFVVSFLIYCALAAIAIFTFSGSFGLSHLKQCS